MDKGLENVERFALGDALHDLAGAQGEGERRVIGDSQQHRCSAECVQVMPLSQLRAGSGCRNRRLVRDTSKKANKREQSSLQDGSGFGFWLLTKKVSRNARVENLPPPLGVVNFP